MLDVPGEDPVHARDRGELLPERLAVVLLLVLGPRLARHLLVLEEALDLLLELGALLPFLGRLGLVLVLRLLLLLPLERAVLAEEPGAQAVGAAVGADLLARLPHLPRLLGRDVLGDLLHVLRDRLEQVLLHAFAGVRKRLLVGHLESGLPGQVHRPAVEAVHDALGDVPVARLEDAIVPLLRVGDERAVGELRRERVRHRQRLVVALARQELVDLRQVVDLVLVLRLLGRARDPGLDVGRAEIGVEVARLLVVLDRVREVGDPLAVLRQPEVPVGVGGRGSEDLLVVQLLPREHVERAHLHGRGRVRDPVLRHRHDRAGGLDQDLVVGPLQDAADELGAVRGDDVVGCDHDLVPGQIRVAPLQPELALLPGIEQAPGDARRPAVLEAREHDPLGVVRLDPAPLDRSVAQLEHESGVRAGILGRSGLGPADPRRRGAQDGEQEEAGRGGVGSHR